MKISTIIWQIIVVALGLFFILTLRTYLEDKNEIEAETNRATCSSLGVSETYCSNILQYKITEEDLQ